MGLISVSLQNYELRIRGDIFHASFFECNFKFAEFILLIIEYDVVVIAVLKMKKTS